MKHPILVFSYTRGDGSQASIWQAEDLEGFIEAARISYSTDALRLREAIASRPGPVTEVYLRIGHDTSYTIMAWGETTNANPDSNPFDGCGDGTFVIINDGEPVKVSEVI